ncbi:deoxyribodipyrimidine photo-lyase [Rheinheimera mesophila]|uniref:Deoxyribodipyrimidine photo-lyase n=1 Tax=Rheinheimera mesophila TaxID=1547515 RepID=A0A3P3QP54_9GAMM|nr:deoxyribodipyrimidine photo-lyase [Rheinheimera mesophila]KKL02269.1 deoxyribodipyrimidine photolyase [Rheinheimera mesophila]RRJ23022.1 deoxyribodipyrimidine photo-lyase [Rheinheimera mesophila]
MTHTAFSLVWLRNDLRIYDHQALFEACQAGLPVVALFIATAQSWQQHDMAAMKQDLIRRRVLQMQTELAALNIPLLAVEGSDYAAVPQLMQQLVDAGASALYAHTEYELRERVRDQKVSRVFANAGKHCYWFDRKAVMPPGSILSKTGGIYQVFTPFKKNWLAHLRQTGVTCFAKPKVMPKVKLHLPELPLMALGDGSSLAYAVAESEVLERMRQFCRDKVAYYQTERDFPALDGTSGLSAYIAIGVISAQQCISRLQLEAANDWDREKSGAAVWLSELVWRDFYHHILVAFPELIKHKAFQKDTDAIIWPNNNALFHAWCEGKTGYPIVDAAMRQLNQTGWMHNRLRMIVASFLVKDLHIDWRWGERYFMSKLIDGDFAANNGGWQWAASTGTDAAPYFRIFNPVTQSERFDPDGVFIKRMLPELADLPKKQIHWPHPLPLWSQYVKPVVDHSKARLKTLELFHTVKKPQDEGDHE